MRAIGEVYWGRGCRRRKSRSRRRLTWTRTANLLTSGSRYRTTVSSTRPRSRRVKGPDQEIAPPPRNFRGSVPISRARWLPSHPSSPNLGHSSANALCSARSSQTTLEGTGRHRMPIDNGTPRRRKLAASNRAQRGRAIIFCGAPRRVTGGSGSGCRRTARSESEAWGALTDQ